MNKKTIYQRFGPGMFCYSPYKQVFYKVLEVIDRTIDKDGKKREYADLLSLQRLLNKDGFPLKGVEHLDETYCEYVSDQIPLLIQAHEEAITRLNNILENYDNGRAIEEDV